MRTIAQWFVAAPEFWLYMLVLVGLTVVSLAAIIWKESRIAVGRWRHRRTAVPRKIVLALTLCLSGCATTYRPKVTGPEPLVFTPTPEQCERLRKERRDYRATERTATWVSGSGALVTTAFLAVPALRGEHAVQGASAGVALLSGAVAIFTGSQVESLEEEIDLGMCLNRPPPALPSLAEGVAEQ
jgi:hypothetical protein